jgi:RNA polymerase sigma-70 factor (sigma-E family)
MARRPRLQGVEAVTAVPEGESGVLDFETWVGSRADALLRFAYVMTGDAALAEDALQDALTSACAKWNRIRSADDPDAYVRRMIVNAHVTWWRRFRRRESPVPDPADRFGRDSVALDGTAARADADAVWTLCATLPRAQRAAVVLRYYEGLSYAEIGAALNCAEATARSHVHRALVSLKSRMGGEEESDG